MAPSAASFELEMVAERSTHFPAHTVIRTFPFDVDSIEIHLVFTE